jgi:hypothetical protein
MSFLARPREILYETQQKVWSAWARRRYRTDFERVERFCLFLGYPRSGHSLVGALLNAHRHAVVSHEINAPRFVLGGSTRDELYSRILARAYWFNLRGNEAHLRLAPGGPRYSYQVPHQWQGRFDELRVIGDKRGGSVTLAIAEHPDFLQRVRELVQVPLRLIHVVRNPFDNISAISIWHDLPLAESIDFYFEHCATTARRDDFCDEREVITIHHEDMVERPRALLSDLCTFLDLELYPGYLDDCCSIVFERPSHTRGKVRWPMEAVRDVEKRARSYHDLERYEFAIGD